MALPVLKSVPANKPPTFYNKSQNTNKNKSDYISWYKSFRSMNSVAESVCIYL